MGDTKFTPGPWKVYPGNGNYSRPAIYAGPGDFVAQLSHGQRRSWQQALADADLIAAAPDLYAALLALYRFQDGPYESDESVRVLRMTDEALAKAEGRNAR